MIKNRCIIRLERFAVYTRIVLVLTVWSTIIQGASEITTAWLSTPIAIASQQADVPWPHEKSDLTPDPNIIFGRLPNGFRYILMENNRPEERVSLHLYVMAGSLNESDSQQGVAHFLEHMLFNGSTHFPPGELIRYFQSIGMQFGNDANAHTGFDETVYDIILPAGDEQHLKKGLLVIHDYAAGASLLEEEINRERSVILAEMRSRDTIGYRTFKTTLGFELPDLLVSQRMPIGKREVIEKVDRALLKDYYDRWYRPDNMILVMVGDFTATMAKHLINTQFKDLAPRATATAPPDVGTIDHQGIKPFYHHEPEAGGTTVSIEVIHMHEPVPDSLSRRRQKLIEDLADRIVQDRLDDRLKKPDSPFTSAMIGSGIYLNRIRYAEITADSNAADWKRTLFILDQELRRAEIHGFSESELTRVKKETLNILENAAKEASTRDSSTLARSIIRNLSANRVIQSPAQEKANLSPVIEKITLEEVHRAFKSNWPDDHRLVLVTGDAALGDDSATPPAAVISDAYLASSKTEVHRFRLDSPASFPYLATPQAAGGVAFRERVDDLGITRIRLENGIWVNLKPTDYKANEVLANLVFGHGRSAEPIDRPGMSLLAEGTMNESGLGGLKSNALERALAGKSTYTDFKITETHCNLSGETVSQEVELLFQLIHAHLLDPGFRHDALLLSRERLRQDYQAFTRSTDGMMRIEGIRWLAGGDNRFGIPPFEQIEAIQLNDIQDWLAPQLKSAPLELSIVGDFEVDEVIELARRYLGTLPERDTTIENPRTDLPRMPVGTIHRIDVDTQIPKALVVSAWQTADFWEISRSRRLSVLSDIFSERLRERIREKLGASYSPFAFNRASRAYRGYGVFQAYVNVAPDQTGPVLKEVRGIAANLVASGVTAEELARVVDPIITSIKTLRRTNGYWLNSVMTESQKHPQQLEWARTFLEDYAAVSTQEINRLAATYLTDERSSAIIIQPKNKP